MTPNNICPKCSDIKNSRELYCNKCMGMQEIIDIFDSWISSQSSLRRQFYSSGHHRPHYASQDDILPVPSPAAYQKQVQQTAIQRSCALLSPLPSAPCRPSSQHRKMAATTGLVLQLQHLHLQKSLLNVMNVPLVLDIKYT